MPTSFLLAVAAILLPAPRQEPAAEREGDGYSVEPSISGDGRLVAFASVATNLVDGDTNGVADVFVRDREAGTTRRVSLGPGGRQANAESRRPVLSSDGRFVAFESWAGNLGAADEEGRPSGEGYEGRIFLHDLESGRTTCVTEERRASRAALSGDGRFVVYQQSGWTAEDGRRTNVFLYDREDGSTRQLTDAKTIGKKEGGDCIHPSISGDGSIVVFESWAETLAPVPARELADHPFDFSSQRRHIFSLERVTGAVRYVSDIAVDDEVYGGFFGPHVSADGRYVAYSHADSRRFGSTWIGFVTDRVGRRPGRLVTAPTERMPAMDMLGLSADGARAIYRSPTDGLVPADRNSQTDVFLWEREPGRSTLVSVSTDGASADGTSLDASISADGRFVAFSSWATNLVAADRNRCQDVFVRDLREGTTSRVSVPSDPAPR